VFTTAIFGLLLGLVIPVAGEIDHFDFLTSSLSFFLSFLFRWCTYANKENKIMINIGLYLGVQLL
jgi:hypothetical protein